MKAPIAARYHIVHSYPSIGLLSDIMHHNSRSDFAASGEIAEAPAKQPPIRKNGTMVSDGPWAPPHGPEIKISRALGGI